MTKIHNSILQAASLAVGNLRSTADRLAQAVERRDFEMLAEISLSYTSWSLDMIRGAATVVARQEAKRSEDAHGERYIEPFDRGRR